MGKARKRQQRETWKVFDHHIFILIFIFIFNFEIDEGGREKHERGKNEGLLRETWKVFDQYIYLCFFVIK